MNFQTKKLKNNLEIIYIPIKQINAVTCLFMINTGSRFETKKENGISHFLEHMFFKGTKNRPNTQKIAYELDSIGASYNAFTSEEYTGFYIKSAKTKIEKSLDILSDMLNNSLFEEKEISKEKGVIVEEINMYEDLPQKQIIDITKLHLYKNTPLGRSTLGTKQTVKSFTKSDFIKYKNQKYTSSNSVLVIAGNYDDKKTHQIVEKLFTNFNNNKLPNYKKAPKIKNTKSVYIKNKKTDQAHITLAIPSFSRHNQDKFTLSIINNILGETMSSRLFAEVREKRGLAYYVGSDTWYFDDTGSIIAYAGVDPKRINEAIKVISYQLKRISQYTITDQEIKKAKDNIEGKMYLGLEDSLSVAEFFAEQKLLHKKILIPSQIIDKIKHITKSDIENISNNIFKKEIKLSIIGNFTNKNKFTKLI
jgi:predicted Zn-dependent peptidase